MIQTDNVTTVYPYTSRGGNSSGVFRMTEDELAQVLQAVVAKIGVENIIATFTVKVQPEKAHRDSPTFLTDDDEESVTADERIIIIHKDRQFNPADYITGGYDGK